MKRTIQFILCLLVGLLFINAGLDKFFHYMPMPKDMPQKMQEMGAAFMTIGWLMPLVGAAEILGGLLLIFKRTRPLGAIVLLPVLIGIVLSNIIATPSPAGITISLVIFAVVIWVIMDNRHRYLPMVSE